MFLYEIDHLYGAPPTCAELYIGMTIYLREFAVSGNGRPNIILDISREGRHEWTFEEGSIQNRYAHIL